MEDEKNGSATINETCKTNKYTFKNKYELGKKMNTWKLTLSLLFRIDSFKLSLVDSKQIFE